MWSLLPRTQPQPLPSSPTFNSLKLKLSAIFSSNDALEARMSSSAALSYVVTLANLVEFDNTLDMTIVNVEKVKEIFFDTQVFGFFANPTL